MAEPAKENPIPKSVALVLVSLGAAWLMLHSDASTLAKLDSMSPADFVQKQRELHHHANPFVYHFLLILLMGGFYLGVIEFLTHVIGLLFKKKPDA